MAPEVIEKKPYGSQCDIYSIGVIFYQIIYGDFPFVEKNEFLLLKKIKK